MAYRNFLLAFIGVCYCFGFTSSQEPVEDSECYTANGRDYEGTQSVTYVRGSKAYEPTVINPEDCLPWTEVRGYMNVTDFDKKLPKNYCRNPNRRLFPYCYVRRNGEPAFAYCHIPTCNTPALLGCYKLTVKEGGDAPSKLNVTDDVILSSVDSMNQDRQMKIGRCLNFCRSKKAKTYEYAGVTRGDSCLCGSESDDGARLKEAINNLHPKECLQYPCAGDRLQACGGDDAIAIYDVDAGSCNPAPVYEKDSGTIYSPRWPGNYHNDAKCQWTIYVPEKYLKDEQTKNFYQLKLHFTYFRVEKGNDTLKLFQYFNSSSSKAHATYTGSFENGMPPIYFEVTETIAVHMVFETDKDHKHDGFIMKYEMVYVGPDTTTAISTTPTTTKTTITSTTSKPSPTTSPKSATTRSTTEPTTKSTTTEKPKTSSPTTAPGKVSSTTKQTKNSTNVAKAVKQESTSSLGGGAVAGVVIGVLVFVIMCIVAAFFVRKHLWAEKGPEAATFNNPVNFNSDTPL